MVGHSKANHEFRELFAYAEFRERAKLPKFDIDLSDFPERARSIARSQMHLSFRHRIKNAMREELKDLCGEAAYAEAQRLVEEYLQNQPTP